MKRGVSGVVLAGGRSSRFGRDKLVEPVHGRRLVDHAIAALRAVADDVVVVLPAGATLELPGGIRMAHDPVPFEGPLVGLVTGLVEARSDVVVVLGGDMPSLPRSIAEALVNALGAAGAEIAVLEHDGAPRPLPMAVRREPALEAARRLVESGERRLGALVEALAAIALDEPDWRALDPNGGSVIDVDVPDDVRSVPRTHEDPHRRRDGGRRG